MLAVVVTITLGCAKELSSRSKPTERELKEREPKGRDPNSIWLNHHQQLIDGNIGQLLSLALGHVISTCWSNSGCRRVQNAVRFPNCFDSTSVTNLVDQVQLQPRL